MAILLRLMDWQARKILVKSILITLSIIFILSILSVFDGMSDYKRMLEAKAEFNQMNKNLFTIVSNYSMYSYMGINSYKHPSANEIFFPKRGMQSEMMGNVDANWTNKVNANCNSRAIFKEDQATSFRFSNILLYLGNFLVILLGFFLYRATNNLKQLISFKSKAIIYFSFLISSILLIALILALLFGVVLLVVHLNSIQIDSAMFSTFIDYYYTTLEMMCFSFLIGSVLAHIKKNNKAYIAIICAWFILVFVVPGINDYMVNKKSESITPYYKFISLKVRIIHDFEIWAKKNFGSFNRNDMDTAKKVIEKYWTGDFKKIEKLNEERSKEIETIYKYKKDLSSINPISFYKHSCTEISSNGYENLLRFNQYLKKLKADFQRFWIDRVYYGNPKVLENFLEKNEGRDVFMAEPQTPSNFTIGITNGIIWCIGLILISYILFNIRMFSINKIKATGCDEVIADFKPGLPYNLFCMDKDFPGILMNVFWGHPGAFNGKLALDGENIVTSKKKDFLYFPNPTKLSVTEKAGDFMTLMLKLASIKKSAIEEAKSEFTSEVLNTPFNELATVDKVSICLTIALSIPSPVYIFENFAVDINRDEDGLRIIRQSKPLVNRDSVVIDMYTVNKSSWLSKGQLFMTNYDEKTGKYSFSKHG